VSATGRGSAATGGDSAATDATGAVGAVARLVDSGTTLVGVIGHPVRHSLSPLLHNTAFTALDLNWTSLAFEVAPGQAAGALDGVRALGLAGISVTMPHKADVAALVDERSPVAATLGAVNCVVNREGVLRGENTDGAGFLASLARGADFDPAGKRCLILGAGGAARAVAVALAGAGCAEVTVVNRTAERAAAVMALADGVIRMGRFDDEGDVAQADLVVNATPVGMAGVGAEHEGWLVAPSLLHGGQVVADLIYSPRPTTWLAAAAQAGARTVDGVGMLVHQAAAQIELWTGLAAPVDQMWEAASALL
jgi:shikimate dehydrogenase